MKTLPLRYNISNIHQLTGCKSNNSRDLTIHVTDFYNQRLIDGTRISVDHPVMGTLFACVIDARGELTTFRGPDEHNHEFTIYDILDELEKYGFYITYNPKENLKGSQIQYLMTVGRLGYNKIRVIKVWDAPLGEKQYKWFVVVFKSEHLRGWLDSMYCPSQKEFQQALVDGYAINVTNICDCHKFRWDWLDYVANIDDILLDNSGDDYVSQYRRT